MNDDMDAVEDSQLTSEYLFRERYYIVDGKTITSGYVNECSYLRYINNPDHVKANCKFTKVKGYISVVTTRQILAGEQLLILYNTSKPNLFNK